MDLYKINLINNTTEKEKMWCFLDEPLGLGDADVYANSNTWLRVAPYDGRNNNSFTIPLQYVVGAGASNQAVGLDTKIESDVSYDSDTKDQWRAHYYIERGEREGPSLVQEGKAAAPGTIAVSTDPFDKSLEPLEHWYSNMTFGVESSSGFMGVSWSPKSKKDYTITPKVKFYVATGAFYDFTLASLGEVSSDSAHITERDFDAYQECTVTLDKLGGWDVYAGPPRPQALQPQLVDAHVSMTHAHASLAHAHDQLVCRTLGDGAGGGSAPALTDGDKAYRVSAGVHMGTTSARALADADAEAVAAGWLVGTVSVSMVLAAGFLYMWSAGIKLHITGVSADGLNYDFDYNGTEASQAIMAAFATGKEILFSKS